MSTIKVDKLQGTSGAVTGLTFSGANGTFGGTLAVTGVHTIGNNAVITSEGGAVTSNLVQGLAKEWVNFDGSGTVAIRDSFNVSSIADNGTGTYQIVLATAMGNTTFTNCTNAVTTIDTGAQAFNFTSASIVSTTSIGVATRREDNNAPSLSVTDAEQNAVSTFGDLA